MRCSSSRETPADSFLTVWPLAGGAALEPLEALVAEVIAARPGYHAALEDAERALADDFAGLAGMANPFLHMGLHIAVIEALQTDRPPGVRAAYQALVGRTGDAHAAEHRMMERLAEELWHAGQEGRPPDAVAWLQALGAVRA